MDLKLPYLHPERMGSGRIRYRVNKDGQKTTIKGEPGSEEFMAAYRAAVEGSAPATEATPKFSMGWLIKAYLGDLRKQVARGDKAQSTLIQRSGFLSPIAAEHGHRDFRLMGTREVKVFLADYDDRPSARDNLHKTLASLFKFAVYREWTEANPANMVPRRRPQTKGFRPWTPADFKAFLDHHKFGSTAHLALTLLAFTGVRRGDLVALDRHMIRDGWLVMDQEKTEAPLVLPILPQLQAALDGPAVGDSALLLNAYGRPFTKDGFGNRMRKWCDDAELKGLAAHGVRKGLGAILAELGCSQNEIATILGHTSPQSAAVYTASARRRLLAESAMKRLADMPWG